MTTFVGALIVACTTGSLLLSSRLPAAAIRLFPFNSLALANLAGSKALPGASAADIATAGSAARKALMQQPGNPIAARTIGVLASLRGDDHTAIRALTYSESMSRRDLLTQLALIEVRVQHGDVAGALQHYDRALRTADSIPLLLSTMISASSDPSIRRQVLKLLAVRPPWRSAFLVQLIDEQTPPDTILGFMEGLRLDRGSPYERQVLAGAVGKLVGQGRVADARLLLPPSAALLRNGGFEDENAFPPLDWALAADANLNGDMEPRPGSHGRGLYLDSRNGLSGEVGWQLLALAPGQYRVTLTAGDVATDNASRPRVRLACGIDGARPLTTMTLPAAPTAGRVVTGNPFIIASSCSVQRLAIVLPTSIEGAAPRPWLDDIAVVSLGPSRATE